MDNPNGTNNKKPCSVAGCGQPRYSTSGYCQTHHRSYMAQMKAQKRAEVGKPPSKSRIRPPVLNPVFPKVEPILADLPRLLVINPNTRVCVEYAPIRQHVARTQKSLEGTRQLLSERPDWIIAVVEDGDGEAK